MKFPSSRGVTVRGMGRALVAIVAVVVVSSIVWLALAVGGRFSPSPTNSPTASSSPIAQVAAPSNEATNDVAEATAAPTPEPTTEASTEPSSEPTPDATPDATPTPTAKPTPKPTRRPTPPPTPDPQPEPTPQFYIVSGSFGATLTNRDMTLRAVHVPVPDWAQSTNCNTSGTDTAGAMEVTIGWAGHTKIPDVGINIIGAGGEDEMGAYGTDGSTAWRSGEPKVFAYCYVAAKAKTTTFDVDRTGSSGVPTIYKWHLH